MFEQIQGMRESVIWSFQRPFHWVGLAGNRAVTLPRAGPNSQFEKRCFRQRIVLMKLPGAFDAPPPQPSLWPARRLVSSRHNGSTFAFRGRQPNQRDHHQRCRESSNRIQPDFQWRDGDGLPPASPNRSAASSGGAEASVPVRGGTYRG